MWSWSKFFIKLTERKFWAMITAVVVCIMVYLGADQSQQLQIASLIGAVGSIITWMIQEAYLDRKKLQSDLISTDALVSAIKTVTESPITSELFKSIEDKLRSWRVNKQSLPDEDEKVGGTD